VKSCQSRICNFAKIFRGLRTAAHNGYRQNVRGNKSFSSVSGEDGGNPITAVGRQRPSLLTSWRQDVFQLSAPTVIGSFGVGLLLLAFFLNLFKFLRVDDWTYILFNLVGGGLACLSSWMIQFLPFVVLEGTWAAVAAVALTRKLNTKDDH
jgi:hypothetical protein